MFTLCYIGGSSHIFLLAAQKSKWQLCSFCEPAHAYPLFIVLMLPLKRIWTFILILLGNVSLSLWGWYFLHVNPGHWVPTSVCVSRSVTSTVTNPESHTHNTLVDCFTHSFDLSHTVQIFLAAISMPHVDNTINRGRNRTLGTIEGELLSPAASMAVIDAKSAIPEDAQTSCVWRFMENTFLQR